MDIRLTNKVKKYAYELGSDLVGIASIDRFKGAPIKMSPQGILPSAKAVIVCAVHLSDGCVELGGVPEPQDMGPYKITYALNDKLDYISFKIAKMLYDSGSKAVPIVSSNIWRYRMYEELNANFAPDISHIYAATAAGLGEIGWHGLTITPEYGTRNRFVSVITDAELVPTPLYDGPKLCDMCGECIKNCPTNAFTKECNGIKVIEIENKKYKFANKNLWRCAWGEHFDLDLNLSIPEKVDEQVILDYVSKHGLRGGAQGVCFKVCIPPFLREKESTVNRRKQHCIPNDVPVHRELRDRIIEIASSNHMSKIAFLSEAQLRQNGIELSKHLPNGKSAILIETCFRLPEGNIPRNELAKQYKVVAEWQCYSSIPDSQDVFMNQYKETAQFLLDFSAIDIARELENQGFLTVVKTDIDVDNLINIFDLNDGLTACGFYKMYEVIVTSANFAEWIHRNKTLNKKSKEIMCNRKNLTDSINEICFEEGAELVGIASSGRINKLSEQLKDIKGDEKIFIAKDDNTRFAKYIPKISTIYREIRTPENYIKNAKSVIILGLKYPETVVERAGKPPAEAVGPYVFTQYETQRLLGHVAFGVTSRLNELGFEAIFTYDLMELGSQVGSPRGFIYDATCNSIEAVAAGLGELTYNGNVYTHENGINQRFIAIITDADLEETKLNFTGKIEEYCATCKKCLNVCPSKAIFEKRKVLLDIEGKKIGFIPIDTVRCNWASKYALCKDDGFKYIGSTVNEIPPRNIDEQSLVDALRRSDPVLKQRPVTAQRCIVDCPLAYGTR